MNQQQRKLDNDLLDQLLRRTDTRVRTLRQGRFGSLNGARDHLHFAKNEFPSQELVDRLVGRKVADSLKIVSATIDTDNGMRGFFYTLQSV